MLELRWGAATHPGLVRETNEDAYVAEPGLFVVADGMGGHSAGEIASAIAVDTLRRAAGGGYRSAEDVSIAVRLANASIRSEAEARSDRAGMGTTVTALVVLDPEQHLLAVANVGDSRLYRLRTGRLSRLTVDHSYVEELVRGGHITPEEARLHPLRNIVTRALGIGSTIEVDTSTITAATGDRYVLCSDGLVDEVPDHEIDALLSGVGDPQEAAEQLIAMANRHGGRDNVTVVVVDVLKGADPSLVVDDPGEPRWAEGAPEPERWADDCTVLLAPVDSGRAASDAAPAPPTTPPSPPAAQVLAGPIRTRTIGVGAFLFWFALAAITTVVVVVALVALRNGSDAPPATTLPPVTSERAPTTSQLGSARTTPPLTTATSPATTRP